MHGGQDFGLVLVVPEHGGSDDSGEHALPVVLVNMPVVRQTVLHSFCGSSASASKSGSAIILCRAVLLL